MSMEEGASRAGKRATEKASEKYYSVLSILLGVGNLLLAAAIGWGFAFSLGPMIGYAGAALVGLWGAHQLVLEIRGPLLVLSAEGIRVRHLSLFRYSFAKWRDIQELRRRGGGLFQRAGLILRGGGEIEVPLFAVLSPSAEKMFEMIKARVVESGG